MKPHIPYGRQDISSDDIQAVTDVLQSDWITQGDTGPRFEHELAAYCGADHAVAVNSATSALHIACLALGLKSGDTLWTTPITFVASANVGLYCGASVDFVDIDARTFNICPKKLERKLEQARRDGQLPGCYRRSPAGNRERIKISFSNANTAFTLLKTHPML